jgi:hypothetical protein
VVPEAPIWPSISQSRSLRRASIFALEEDISSILHVFLEVFQLTFARKSPLPKTGNQPAADRRNQNLKAGNSLFPAK